MKTTLATIGIIIASPPVECSDERRREARREELRETIRLWDEFRAKAPMQDLVKRLDRNFDIYRSELSCRDAHAARQNQGLGGK